MNHTRRAVLAYLLLKGLTVVFNGVAEASLGAWALAGISVVTVMIVGIVFLELGRAWWVWLVMAVRKRAMFRPTCCARRSRVALSRFVWFW